MTPNEQALERSTVSRAARRVSSTRPPANEQDEAEPSPPSKRTLRGRQTWDAAVKRVDRPTETLALLQLEVEFETFQFQAGQFTMVHGVAADGPRRRAYSIAPFDRFVLRRKFTARASRR